MPDNAEPPTGPGPADSSGQTGSRVRNRHRQVAALRALKLVLWVLTALGTIVVVAAWLFPYDLERTGRYYDRMAWAAFMVRSLGVQLGIAAVAVLVLALALRRWRNALVLTLVAAFLLAPLIDVTEQSRTPGRTSFRLMSANVFVANDDHDRFLAQVAAIDPDILLLQEYSPAWHRAVGPSLVAQFTHSSGPDQTGAFGVSIYSKFPLRATSGLVKLGTGIKPQLRAVLRVRGQDVTVYDVHPSVAVRVANHVEHRRQIADLATALRGEQNPTIVAGDMNFTDTSVHHRVILDAGMRSAWQEVGRGRGSTWQRPGVPNWIPGLPLDHIFVSKGLEVDRMRIAPRTGSDHRAVYADVQVV